MEYNANITYNGRKTADIKSNTKRILMSVSDIKSRIRDRILEVAQKREQTTKIEKKAEFLKMLKIIKLDDLFEFKMIWR